MNRIIKVILFLLILSTYPVLAQNDNIPKLKEIKGDMLNVRITPREHKKKGLWGYADRDGWYVIKPVFTQACPYEYGVARVCVDDRWGIIGRNGLFVVTPKYDEIKSFSKEGIAIAVNNGINFLINTKGNNVNDSYYALIEEADYGYVAFRNGTYSTIDRYGSVLLADQFDELGDLERRRGLSYFLKDDKWGILKDGIEILEHKWDSCPKFLCEGNDDMPSLFSAELNGTVGIITSDGRYVTPSIYDDIYMDESSQYFITKQNGLYGALSRTLSVIMSPVSPVPPILTKELYRVYDGYDCYAANIKGGNVKLQHCSDLYEAYRPNDYETTTELPEWMKQSIIDENIEEREEKIYEASAVCRMVAAQNYDVSRLKGSEDIPEDIPLSFYADNNNKYGVKGSYGFVQRAKSIVRNNKTYSTICWSGDGRVALASESNTREYYLIVNNGVYSLRDIMQQYNVKPCKGVTPKDLIYTSNGDIILRLAFVRYSDDVMAPLIESDEDKLPVQVDGISEYTYPVSPAECSDAIICFSKTKSEITAFAPLQSSDAAPMIASKFGGFYTTSATKGLLDSESVLRKYDENGNLCRTFTAKGGEQFHDIEETENYIYLGGSIVEDGVMRPYLMQFSKYSEHCKSWKDSTVSHYFSGIKCSGFILYAKMPKRNSLADVDYHPHYALPDLDDEVGVRPCCVWEDWGGKEIGGCGLIDVNGKWLQAPIYFPDQQCAAFNWEFKEFKGKTLVVNHFGKYGLMGRDGSMIFDFVYDNIEHLKNPNYFKVTQGRYCGVVKINGDIIVPLKYDDIGDMSDDIIVVCSGGFYGCYNKHGNEIVPCIYSNISEFSNGVSIVTSLQKIGYMNSSGRMFVQPIADEAYPFSEGCARVVVDGLVGYIDLNGNWIIAPRYQDGGNCSCGIIPVMLAGAYSYINKDTVQSISRFRYDVAKDFDPEYQVAIVSRGGKWGVINTSGTEIVPVSYDVVHIMPDGYIYAEQGTQYDVYDIAGNRIFSINDAQIHYEVGKPLYNKGYITVGSSAELVKYDKHGNMIYNYQYLTM